MSCELEKELEHYLQVKIIRRLLQRMREDLKLPYAYKHIHKSKPHKPGGPQDFVVFVEKKIKLFEENLKKWIGESEEVKANEEWKPGCFGTEKVLTYGGCCDCQFKFKCRDSYDEKNCGSD